MPRLTARLACAVTAFGLLLADPAAAAFKDQTPVDLGGSDTAAASDTTAVSPISVGGALRMAVTLLFICGLIYAIARFMKYWQARRDGVSTGASGAVRTLSVTPVAKDVSIVITRAGDKIHVLSRGKDGSTQQLRELDFAEAAEEGLAIDVPAPARPSLREFARSLKRSPLRLKRRRRHAADQPDSAPADAPAVDDPPAGFADLLAHAREQATGDPAGPGPDRPEAR